MQVLSILAGLCFFVISFTFSYFYLLLYTGTEDLVALLLMWNFGRPALVLGMLFALWAIWKKVGLLLKSLGYGITAGLMLTFCLWFYQWQRDLSEVILFADYYNEEGFELYLREDLTFKIQETSMIGGPASYGTYALIGDSILLAQEIKLTGGCLLDRLMIRKGKSIHFTCKNGVVDRQSIGPLYINHEK